MRFRTREMIMEAEPDTPVEGTVYPKFLSAEYFQSIHENTLFNHLGYEERPKEAFGVAELTLGIGEVGLEVTGYRESLSDIPGPNSTTFAFDPVGDGGLGQGSVVINLAASLSPIADREDVSFLGKFSGISRFTSASTYTVMLSIDQFVGVDFDFPRPLISGAPWQPLLNPNYPSVFDVLASDPRNRQIFNRHTASTRRTNINMYVANKTSTGFQIFVTRTNTYIPIQYPISQNPFLDESVAPIYDYYRPNTLSSGTVLYTNPQSDPVSTTEDDLPDFDLTTESIVGVPRNKLRVAWLARGW